MTTIAHIYSQHGRLMVSGQLNFSSANKIWNASLPLLANQQEWHFDLSKVISSNSAGLALLIEWIKYAKQMNKVISFTRLPEQLQSIARIAGVEHFIKSD